VPEIEDEDVESDTLLKAGRDAIEPSKTKDEPLGGTDMSGAILEMNGLSGGRAEELMHADSMQLRKQLESAAQMFMPAPQTFSLNERPPVDSLREFAVGDLGYRDIPEPDEFANTAMEKLDATKKLAVDTLAKKESRQAVTTAERPLTATGDAAAESGRVATSELLARAELAWQTAISDSSNVYDVIFARLLTERVLRAEAEKATWANRLMQLVRLEQFERNRWLESRSQDSSTAPAND
jgi:hypothetical protein